MSIRDNLISGPLGFGSESLGIVFDVAGGAAESVGKVVAAKR
jgi:hypothetical protein